MEKQEAQRRLAELREQVRYHSRKYYTEDDPEISDFEYDQLYRQLETLEGEYPELVTADSPTQKIGGAVYNTFAEVVHQVPLESLHDSFSQEEPGRPVCPGFHPRGRCHRRGCDGEHPHHPLRAQGPAGARPLFGGPGRGVHVRPELPAPLRPAGASGREAL